MGPASGGTLSRRISKEDLDPSVERIPAISTAMYPAPTITLRLQRSNDAIRVHLEPDKHVHRKPGSFSCAQAKDRGPEQLILGATAVEALPNGSLRNTSEHSQEALGDHRQELWISH